ncbi:MAG: cold shock domain-containing protein [Flavobacteriaceae bacterium]|nr:cold shock domain-containing protein [Flavobacteriaceae bacterium]
MAKSQQTFNKIEKEKKRLKKREIKEKKKAERKANAVKPTSLEDMLVYVDEFGQLTDTPPDPTKKKEEIDLESIDIFIPKKVAGEEDDAGFGNEGKVSFFDDSKGFGFIIDSKNQEKYFVHVSGLIDEIKENDKVSYELEKGMKGMNAVRVKKI